MPRRARLTDDRHSIGDETMKQVLRHLAGLGGVEVADPLAARSMPSPSAEDARRAIGHVVERHKAAGLPVRDLGLRCHGQPLVHGAASGASPEITDLGK